mgnify:CR=1 FL=1
MKAIYIPTMVFDPDKDIDILNDKIKDYHNIIYQEYVSMPGDDIEGPIGQIIIVDNYFEEK